MSQSLGSVPLPLAAPIHCSLPCSSATPCESWHRNSPLCARNAKQRFNLEVDRPPRASRWSPVLYKIAKHYWARLSCRVQKITLGKRLYRVLPYKTLRKADSATLVSCKAAIALCTSPCTTLAGVAVLRAATVRSLVSPCSARCP